MAQAEMAMQLINQASQTAVNVTDAAAHITDVVNNEIQKAKEQARSNNNEYNIRKNFLLNSVDAIRTCTIGQYNIVVCTDQEHDQFLELKGQILPMDLVQVEVS